MEPKTVDPKQWKARQASLNPIYPYTWVAVYNDGTYLQQFEMDKAYNSLDIDRSKLKSLVVMNHPISPIEIVVPYPSPPTEVVIKATVGVSYKLGMQTMQKHSEKITTKYKFGFKYRLPQAEEEVYLVVIDLATGEVYKTNRDE